VQIKMKERGHRGKKGLVVLTDKNYERKFEKSQSNWMIAYSSGAKGKALKTAWGKAGKALNNHVKFGWIDCDGKGKELCEDHQVTDLPHVVSYKNGPKMDVSPKLYTGEHTAANLTAHAKAMIVAGSPKIMQIKKKIITDWMKLSTFNPHFLYIDEAEVVPELIQAVVLEYEDGTDAEILWGAAMGRQAKRVLKHLSQTEGQPLPVLLQIIAEPNGKPYDDPGQMSVAFGMRGFTADNFHETVAFVDQVATKWTYERVQYAKEYKKYMPGLHDDAGVVDDDGDDQSALKDEL